jgi:beta-lactamase superfamily II metal-dependent hydrolase
MSVIKSYCVGNGDMFHIEHNSDNFTIIDCCLDEDTTKPILAEIAKLQAKVGITRFISTHPDEDHIQGLDALDDKIGIANFYCVKNKATKKDATESFKRYCALRDDAKKAFYLYKGCQRKWMNLGDQERGCAGINIVWPNTENKDFKQALKDAEAGSSPNNISPIIKYEVNEGVTAVWMGDLETDFLEAIEDELDLPKVDLLFAPHHGRDSGKVPESLLEKMDPKIIIIGEVPCEDLNYYAGYDTITQNSAGDIIFECDGDAIHIFTSNDYEADFLEDKQRTRLGYYYIGSLPLSKKAVAARTV